MFEWLCGWHHQSFGDLTHPRPLVSRNTLLFAQHLAVIKSWLILLYYYSIILCSLILPFIINESHLTFGGILEYHKNDTAAPISGQKKRFVFAGSRIFILKQGSNYTHKRTLPESDNHQNKSVSVNIITLRSWTFSTFSLLHNTVFVVCFCV